MLNSEVALCPDFNGVAHSLSRNGSTEMGDL